MAEKKELVTILCPDLSLAEKTALAHTVMTPGWQVVIKMANEACLRATQDCIKLDPESADYERIAVERQRRARNITEFSDLFMRSAFGHKDSIVKHNATEEKEAVDAVANRFGIHTTPPEAVKSIYGIHPAKPKPRSAKKQ